MIHGGVNGSTFGCFLLNLLKVYPEILDPSKRYCLLFNNATIHKSKKLKKLLEYMMKKVKKHKFY